ncbi:hypothetical protein [Limnohabitans sp. G3-2]|uniref:hypothetical protein n=1 Tax=Limnohabitans sp. G3-2 TaxID=1100711 RepID=UPI000C1F8B87|nr:hypothetical protein [Limnohabitans sp. G3-2]PIT77068.1 hypothetical protein B9Z31_03705 [Limnohabitans sp. G3-2]
MLERLSPNVKLAGLASALLPCVMWLMRLLSPDLSWGFAFLFGLQVLLLLTALHLVVTSIWGPASRWNLPKPAADSQRRIFAQKGALVARWLALLGRAKSAALAPFLRLFRRQTP